MPASRQHYERAFESYLRRARIPHVMVDDARRAILPPGAELGVATTGGREKRLKSFDFVVYGEARHALIEVKGRRVDLRRGGSSRRESWTTMDDIESMSAWERLFGEPFEATLVFLHWLDGPAPIIREPGAFRFEGRSYAPRAVRVAEYTRRMCVRSPRWGTVHLPEEVYERIWADLPDLLSAASRNGR